jgi:hypothetical protein
MSVLAELRIPLHYDSSDFAEDMKTISLLSSKATHDHHQ